MKLHTPPPKNDVTAQPSNHSSAALYCEPQVKGHVAANLRVGNDRARLIDVMTQLLPFLGYPRRLNGLRAIDEVAPAKTQGDAP